MVLLQGGTAGAQEEPERIPPFPLYYRGEAEISGGVPVPDGYHIVARIVKGQELYESEPVLVEGGDGGYRRIKVAPPDWLYDGETVTFHLDGVQAEQTDTFVGRSGPSIDWNFLLTFPNLPEPTPTPTHIPTPTHTPTETPMPAEAAVFSGTITVAGQNQPPEVAVLVARVGDYESTPAFIEGETYSGLVLDPGDPDLLGQQIEFYLNEVKASTTATYESGSFNFNFDLAFVGLPSPTPIPTDTPTATHTPAAALTSTPTSVPTPSMMLTMTPSPIPTQRSTPIPTPTPTSTSTPSPTSTPAPTSTPVPRQPSPLSTASPSPTATSVPTGGGCLSSPDTPLSAALANALLLFAPLGLIVGIRLRRRRR